MKTMHSYSNKRPYLGLLIMGTVSAVLYAVLLLKQDMVIGIFSRGGVYAVLPIITAFIFSFFHGGFTERFWRVLGIDAKNTKRRR